MDTPEKSSSACGFTIVVALSWIGFILNCLAIYINNMAEDKNADYGKIETIAAYAQEILIILHFMCFRRQTFLSHRGIVVKSILLVLCGIVYIPNSQYLLLSIFMLIGHIATFVCVTVYIGFIFQEPNCPSLDKILSVKVTDS